MIKVHQIKSTLTIAMPLIAAFLAQKAMQFIDTLMMGWIGPAALAAGAIGTAVFITIIVFCMGTLSAVGVFIARAKGAGDKNDIQSSLQNGIVMALILAIPCIAIIWFAPQLLFSQQNQQVADNAALLLHGLSIGLPGYLLFLVFREFISAFSLTRIVMITAISSIPLTFILNYILIYGKFGLPALGVSGIGYASALVMWVLFFGLLAYASQHHQLKEFIHFKLPELNLIKIKDMFYIGLPSGAFFLLEAAMFLSCIMIIGHFGVDALASFQIAMQCANIAYSIPFAISMATALQVSHATGAKEFLRIKSIIIQNFGLGLIFSIIIAICFILFPAFFVKIFLNAKDLHTETFTMAISFLSIAAFFQCFDTIQAIANGALRGLKDTLIPMLVSITCYWLLALPCAYYLSFHTSLGAKGAWYGISLGICSLAVILTMRILIKLSQK